MSYIATKVSPYDDMPLIAMIDSNRIRKYDFGTRTCVPQQRCLPCGIVFLVKFFLNECCHILKRIKRIKSDYLNEWHTKRCPFFSVSTRITNIPFRYCTWPKPEMQYQRHLAAFPPTYRRFWWRLFVVLSWSTLVRESEGEKIGWRTSFWKPWKRVAFGLTRRKERRYGSPPTKLKIVEMLALKSNLRWE